MVRKLYGSIIAIGVLSLGMGATVAWGAGDTTPNCTCGIAKFDVNDLSQISTNDLVACKSTLSTVASNQCKEQLDSIKTELDKRNKLNALDDALTITPDAFDFHFDAGYSFTTVNTLWTKGNPRVSLGLYRTFSMNEYKNGGHNKRTTGWDIYGMHLDAQIKLTDTGAQTAVAVGTAPKLGPQRALDFEASSFFPFYTDYIQMYKKQRREYIALAALWGAMKVDTNNLMLTRHYFGLRSFVSAESYVDLLFGRAKQAAGTRMLIRGQMPFNFPGTNQIIYLGLEGNYALNSRNGGNTTDTIQGYVTWDIDNLLSQFASK